MKAEKRRAGGRAHKARERLFLPLIEGGIFSIDEAGAVWRHAVRHVRRDEWVSIPARRAEKDAGEYLQIHQTINGKRLLCQVNRLVWQHFNGAVPDGMEVNHDDGNKKNNHPRNLTLMTRSENMAHAFSTGLHRGVRGEDHKGCRHSDDIVRRCITLRRREGLTLFAISAATGVSPSQVYRITSGKSRRSAEP